MWSRLKRGVGWMVLILILAFINPSNNFAQVNDTVFIQVNDNVLILLSTPDYSQLEHFKETRHLIPGFQKNISLVNESLDATANYRITYLSNDELTIDTIPSKIRYIYEDGYFVPYPWRHVARLRPGVERGRHGPAEPLEVIIYFNSFAELINSDLQACVNKTIGELPGRTRRSVSLFYDCRDDSTVLLREDVNAIPYDDTVEFKLGAGLGFIKDRWIVNIGFGVGVILHKKGIQRNHIYISDDLHYVFDQRDRFQIYNFLNVGYAIQLSKDTEKENWIGFEAGYLTNKTSAFFDVGTVRVALKKDICRYCVVSGQLYFDSGFERAYPGVGFHFGF
jgi:hypothetical protein